MSVHNWNFFNWLNVQKKFIYLFKNVSLSICKSCLIILLSKPRSICSPGWFGIIVVRPSGCSKNLWLPFCRLKTKPIFNKIFVTSREVSKGSFDIMLRLNLYLLQSQKFIFRNIFFLYFQIKCNGFFGAFYQGIVTFCLCMTAGQFNNWRNQISVKSLFNDDIVLFLHIFEFYNQQIYILLFNYFLLFHPFTLSMHTSFLAISYPP